MVNYSDKKVWQGAVIGKYKGVQMKRTRDNIMFYHNHKLVASFNVTSNNGFIL